MYEPIPPTKSQLLANCLHIWWWNRGWLHIQYSTWPWPPRTPTREEQVQAIVADLVQDADLATIELYTFLGTPEGQVIAAAVEMAIPLPYRIVVQEALTLICHQRGAGRQAFVGITAVAALFALIIGLSAAIAE